MDDGKRQKVGDRSRSHDIGLPSSRCLSHLFTLFPASLRQYRDLKRRQRRQQREQQKSNRFFLANNNFARSPRVFVHYLAVIARLQTCKCLISRFVEHGNTRKQLSFFFLSGSLIQSFRIKLQKNLPTIDESNEME